MSAFTLASGAGVPAREAKNERTPLPSVAAPAIAATVAVSDMPTILSAAPDRSCDSGGVGLPRASGAVASPFGYADQRSRTLVAHRDRPSLCPLIVSGSPKASGVEPLDPRPSAGEFDFWPLSVSLFFRSSASPSSCRGKV